LEQANDLGPHDLIQEILPHGAVVTAWTAEMAPRVRADAAIVVNPTRARPSRDARERVATLTTAHQPLDQAGLNRSTPRSDFVLLQQFLRTGKGRLLNEGGHRDFDPLVAGPFSVGAVAHGDAAPQPQASRHPLTGGDTRFAKAGGAD